MNWECEATLSCGHRVHFGVLTTDDANEACPRRKDGSFAALRCPHGRRRVVVYLTSTTNLRASRPEAECANKETSRLRSGERA